METIILSILALITLVWIINSNLPKISQEEYKYLEKFCFKDKTTNDHFANYWKDLFDELYNN